jgi:hypothetical protein
VSAGVEFPGTSVLRHAAAVSAASEQMTEARSAVREVTMDSGAYGRICQFLPDLLTPLFCRAADAMNDAVEALGETALKLRTTAADTAAVDAAGACRLDSAVSPGRVLPL